ncbi:MAG: glycosyltransferase family 2 protein [Candidatus Edwardsbacteria bacterium]|nr:glycosyltransferase family 2 protein [Candidatus Edwardsbacteria bacterium]MBU1575613.1 glycosyltransferase family 2 protein [Candidatus Edwardsbacteria bacterium]MBU2464038.1 glycosyltransferase family 2 protein [Candidatus Edwardsbacteria bacterium]MBU2593883.1 glycosyltransferase family 2 protein [Candidatus Edwardsbacteria bacterium]
MADQPLVYIVVLNYNGYQDTLECLESLEKLSYGNFRVVVADNCSTDASESLIRAGYPGHSFIQTGKNLGYAGGNNAGIRLALEHQADYVCLLNNDTTITPEFLEPLVNWMEQDKITGIVGPKVCDYYDKNIIQATGSRANLFFGKFYQLNGGKNKDEIKGVFEVDYVAGSCLLVRSELISKIGFIPEEYFLFFEETEWCLKFKRAGYKVMCLCESVIYHKGSKSTEKVDGIQEYYMCRNSIIFEKRNANKVQWTIFYLYKLYRMALSLAKGRITGNLNQNMLKGFRDGIGYRKSA